MYVNYGDSQEVSFQLVSKFIFCFFWTFVRPSANAISLYFRSNCLVKLNTVLSPYWRVWSLVQRNNSLWTWHDKCNICCRYYIYHVKFNVCLVTKPLWVFMAERFASVCEDELCEKCVIKQLLNSVFAWYHELSKPRVCVICLSLRLRQITQTSVLIIHDIMLNLIQ